MRTLYKVAPSRVRGLKPFPTNKLYEENVGRTLTGAWIETELQCFKRLFRFLVAPSRVRGLKPYNETWTFRIRTSHPHGCVD